MCKRPQVLHMILSEHASDVGGSDALCLRHSSFMFDVCGAAPPVRLRCSYIFVSKSESLRKTRGWLKAYPGPKQPFTIYSWGPRRLIFRVLCEVGELACGGWLLLLICAKCIPQPVVDPFFWLIPSHYAFMHFVLALLSALFQYWSIRNPQPCLLLSTGLLILWGCSAVLSLSTRSKWFTNGLCSCVHLGTELIIKRFGKGKIFLRYFGNVWRNLLSFTFKVEKKKNHILHCQVSLLVIAWGSQMVRGMTLSCIPALWRAQMRCGISLNSFQSLSGVKRKHLFRWEKFSGILYSSFDTTSFSFLFIPQLVWMKTIQKRAFQYGCARFQTYYVIDPAALQGFLSG